MPIDYQAVRPASQKTRGPSARNVKITAIPRMSSAAVRHGIALEVQPSTRLVPPISVPMPALPSRIRQQHRDPLGGRRESVAWCAGRSAPSIVKVPTAVKLHARNHDAGRGGRARPEDRECLCCGQAPVDCQLIFPRAQKRRGPCAGDAEPAAVGRWTICSMRVCVAVVIQLPIGRVPEVLIGMTPLPIDIRHVVKDISGGHWKPPGWGPQHNATTEAEVLAAIKLDPFYLDRIRWPSRHSKRGAGKRRDDESGPSTRQGSHPHPGSQHHRHGHRRVTPLEEVCPILVDFE
jgi:hypothetical protein